MRILIGHLGTRGGGPQMQAEIARALSDLGCNVSIAYDTASEMSGALRALDFPAVRVGSIAARAGGVVRLALRVFAQPIDAVRIALFCRAHEIDVLFEPMGNPLQLLPRRALKLMGIRVLTSVHDAVRHPGEENALLSWIAKDDLRSTDGVVVYSDSVASALGHVAVPVFRTVHGAFGTPAPVPRTLRPGRQVVGFFGRVEKYKGIERLASALEMLRAKGHDVRGSVVGRGALDVDIVDRLERVGVEIDNRWVQEQEILGIISAFDVLALPYDEASQSGVVGFALNAGVPIVATPVGGLAEQVSAAGGVVAPDMDPKSFANAIERLISDEPEYSRVSSRQLQAAETVYGWTRVASDVLAAARAITPGSPA